jgi:hypothetical protein
VDVSRDRIADPANIVESKIVGNDAAPSIGSEFDLSGQQ